jgi:hypothetical protein
MSIRAWGTLRPDIKKRIRAESYGKAKKNTPHCLTVAFMLAHTPSRIRGPGPETIGYIVDTAPNNIF